MDLALAGFYGVGCLLILYILYSIGMSKIVIAGVMTITIALVVLLIITF